MIRFEDPPPRGRKPAPPGYHAKAAAELKAHRGKWARVGDYSTVSSASAMARNIRNASIAAYSPPGAFEAKSRTVDGEHRVYVRYTGGSDA